MRIERYLELIARVSYYGVKLYELEKELSGEWGCSPRQVYYYVQKLRDEGYVRVRRYKDGLWVEPTPKLKAWIVRVEEGYPLKLLRHYRGR